MLSISIMKSYCHLIRLKPGSRSNPVSHLVVKIIASDRCRHAGTLSLQGSVWKENLSPGAAVVTQTQDELERGKDKGRTLASGDSSTKEWETKTGGRIEFDTDQLDRA